jgi:transcriptional regulator with XRE-family HTH domain
VDALRLGATFRAIRIRKGWRQADVARQSGVSPTTVSRIERGRIEGLTIRSVLQVAAPLEIRVDWQPRWRGGELDRMLNAGHAAMHEAVARSFTQAGGWLAAAEATFAIYGERGAIDVLAFHPQSRAVLVVELKTTLVDVQGLIGAVDRYVRLAPQIARDRGWAAESVSSWVLLRESPTNHRRLAAHASVLRAAFPADGRRMRGWLANPVMPIRALSFLSVGRAGTAIAALSGAQRVRRPQPRSAFVRNGGYRSPRDG